jgi:SH3-like domain-containing protein
MLRLLALISFGALLVLASSEPSAAQGTGASGQPVPRFVSLRSDRVNVRQGPSRDHQVVWTFTRAGLPVEITAEFENWRRIRDSEGSEGWVQTGLLSSRRTAIVAPWRREQSFDLHVRAQTASEVRARLEAGVIVSARSCDGTWCRVTAERLDGFLRQEVMWGVYPGERFD